MRTKILAVMLAAVALIAGCKVESKADFVKTANTGTLIINGCSIAVEAGALKQPRAGYVEVAVRTFDNCMIGDAGWYVYLQDPNITPPPDIVLCATETLIEIIAQAKEAGIEMPVSDMDNVDIDTAAARLEIACNRYYEIVGNLP